MSKSKIQWQNLQEKGCMTSLRIMLFFYRIGGKYLFKFILLFVVAWYWLCSKTARQSSLEYLNQVHKYYGVNSPFKKKPNLWLSYTHFLSFGDSLLDKLAGWLGDIPEDSIKILGEENFDKYRGKGAIFIISHFGNMELARALKNQINTMNILVYTKHSTSFHKLLQKINPKAGLRLLSVDDFGIETAFLLQERLDAGEWIIIAADRTPIASARTQQVDFLGRSASLPEGAWILASIMKAPIVLLFGYKYQQQFELHIHPFRDKLDLPKKVRPQILNQTISDYAKIVEKHCHRAPLQWFNFFHFWD